jgi:four helix bundle protein
MDNERKNPLKDKSYSFALKIIQLYQYLSKEKKEFVLLKQLLRSGTSIGSMIEEANQAESKADFIHKLSIANKEANETRYWLRLFKDAQYLDSIEATAFIADCEELLKLLTAILKTTKQNQKK